MSKEYTLKLNEKQLLAISSAMDLLSRLQSGQVEELINFNTIFDKRVFNLEDKEVSELKIHIGGIKSIIFPELEKNQFYGITSDKTPESAKIMWDIHQVLRHRISWDYAIEKNYTDGKVRNWNKMMGVSFDNPLKTSIEPLVKIC